MAGNNYSCASSIYCVPVCAFILAHNARERTGASKYRGGALCAIVGDFWRVCGHPVP